MNSKKISLKKMFLFLWLTLAAILLINNLFTIISYSKYKKGQDFGISCILIATDEFNEYKDNKKELVNEIYKYFNRSYYSYNTQYGTTISNVEESLEKILKTEGYDEGYSASYYFKHTNYLSYYFYKNSTLSPFIIIYGITCAIILILNISYSLSRKVKITINDNMIIYKKATGKTKQFLIKNVTSVETLMFKGLKVTGNGFKVKTFILKNNEELKNYIINALKE